MKRFPFPSWLILVLAAATFARGSEAPAEKSSLPPPSKVGQFVALDAIDWKAVLPPPPAPGSVAVLGEIETVLRIQATRSAADEAWAKTVEQDNVFADYTAVLGPWFDRANLPVLAGFLQQVTADVQAENKQVKDLYPRKRPYAVEPTVQPCVSHPGTNSYPSGHTLRAFVWAGVLADVFPDRQAEIYARAHEVAWGRVIGGVHFPSDTVGGRIAASAVIAEMRKNPAYRAAIERCRAEVAPFLLKKAA